MRLAPTSAAPPEVSAYWIDAETGELCRCRPDWVSPVGERQAILPDVKTCGDAIPEDFKRQIARMRYHVQNAFYVDGYEAANGVEVLGARRRGKKTHVHSA